MSVEKLINLEKEARAYAKTLEGGQSGLFSMFMNEVTQFAELVAFLGLGAESVLKGFELHTAAVRTGLEMKAAMSTDPALRKVELDFAHQELNAALRAVNQDDETTAPVYIGKGFSPGARGN